MHTYIHTYIHTHLYIYICIAVAGCFGNRRFEHLVSMYIFVSQGFGFGLWGLSAEVPGFRVYGYGFGLHFERFSLHS